MPHHTMESLVQGVDSLEMSCSPVAMAEFESTSAPPSSRRPPHHPPMKQHRYGGSSSGSHSVPRDRIMKTIYAPSGSMVVSKRSSKTAHLVMHKDGDNSRLDDGKVIAQSSGVGDNDDIDQPVDEAKIFDSNGAVELEPVNLDPSPAKEARESSEGGDDDGKVIAQSSVVGDNDGIEQPVDEAKISDSKDAVEPVNLDPSPAKETVRAQPKLGDGLSSSPQGSFYSATQYAEAKESSEGKSVESGEASHSCDLVESRKTSIYRGSSGSDVSDESSSSSFTSAMYKPHKANDTRWEAIQAVRSCNTGSLELKNFRIFKRLGCGDIGSVHLAELIGTRTLFAMKVMDKEALASRKKILRAQTEREILQSLDHPFLPTLYTHFETEKFSFLVMEFCPGGDLHALRQKQPGKFFPEHAARFYLAEVLLALEYLHMLGIIYRDLKPENVLVREDGHIMLSDFDLSLRCAVSPTLVKSSTTNADSKNSGYCIQPTCIEPSCTLQPPCIQPTCFGPRFLSKAKKSRPKTETPTQVTHLPELIAEPTSARSMSFVGTHEYLAPEIIKGEGHGSAVDWWTLGVFLYELLFGRTPFKGAGNRATLFNVVGQPLRFPDTPTVSFAARDLIRGLLVKEPQHRLAYRRGATEIKQHPFFQSVNWALIRCASPPEVPPPLVVEAEPTSPSSCGGGKMQGGGVEVVKSSGNYYEIDFF